MMFDNDDISAQNTENAMRELEKVGANLQSGEQYNRVFEMIYLLFTKIEILEKQLAKSSYLI